VFHGECPEGPEKENNRSTIPRGARKNARPRKQGRPARKDEAAISPENGIQPGICESALPNPVLKLPLREGMAMFLFGTEAFPLALGPFPPSLSSRVGPAPGPEVS
jgi:hypothetical protein